MKNLLLFFLVVLLFLTGSAFAEEIVYSQLTGDYWQIWSMNLTTKKATQLTTTPFDKRDPQCNSEGTQLIYRSANAELFILDHTQKDYPSKQILKNAGAIMSFQWSKDGQKLLFSRLRSDIQDDSDIWLADLVTEKLEEVTRAPLIQYYPQFYMSDSLLFVGRSNLVEGQNLWQKKIHQSDEWIKLTFGTFYDLLPDVAPDEKTVVFSSNRAESFDIWKLNMFDRHLTRLTSDAGLETSPSFSLDGKVILYVSSASGSKQIWTMTADGENQIQISDNATSRQEPSWCTLNILENFKNE